MNALTVVFVAALILGTAVQAWLVYRHRRHVAYHRGEVPEAFKERISLAVHRKAADYTRAKADLGLVEIVVGALLLVGWTLGGGLAWLDAGWRSLALGPVTTGVAIILSAFVIIALLELPFALYRTFVIERRFGFNRQTPKLFAVDELKKGLLLLVLGAPLAALVLWLMNIAGTAWWLYVWVVWLGFTLVIVWAFPVFIAPLFNKFTPLDDQRLRERIERLLSRNGFASSGIFVADGSRRSGHGNAYFTGLGANKRIVFFDTLLESLGPDEVEAVLAHEVGHFKRRHVGKRMILNAALSFAGLTLLGWLLDKSWFYAGLGVTQPSMPIALLLFLMVIPVFAIFLQPLSAWFSRKHEFEADDFAASQADPRSLIEALVKLYRENASTLTPDPLYSAFHDSHPPAPVRILHLSSKIEAAA